MDETSTTLPVRPRELSGWRRWLGLAWLSLLIIIIVILGVVVWRNRDLILSTLQTAQYGFFVLTFLFYGAANFAMAIGWHLVMRQLSVPLKLAVNIRIYFYTLAARRLPGTLWYIAGRAILYQRLGIPKRVTSVASGVEAVLSIVTGLIIGAPALFIQMGLSWTSITLFALVLSFGLMAIHPSVLRKIGKRISADIDPGVLSGKRTLASAVCHLIMWFFGGLMVCSVILALYPISLYQIPLVISLWALSGVISFLAFFLPYNFGLTEISLTFMLSLVVPVSIAVSVAIILRILTTIFDIMWSSLIIFERNKRILGRAA